jgi:hypothetical protein
LCAIESICGVEGRRKGATGSFLALNCGNDDGELENGHARFDASFSWSLRIEDASLQQR